MCTHRVHTCTVHKDKATIGLSIQNTNLSHFCHFIFNPYNPHVDEHFNGIRRGLYSINTKKYNVFAPMGRFQLESIYLYFPPSSQLVYLCFCPDSIIRDFRLSFTPSALYTVKRDLNRESAKMVQWNKVIMADPKIQSVSSRITVDSAAVKQLKCNKQENNNNHNKCLLHIKNQFKSMAHSSQGNHTDLDFCD